MIFQVKIVTYFIFAVFFLRVAGPCNCKKDVCSNSPYGVVRYIFFKLKDRVTGNDILINNGNFTAVPDSIKLKDIKTGFFYQLYTAPGPNGLQVYTQQYSRPAGIIDSLVFFFGNSVPDTLVVHTGLIDGWRGDECPTVKDAGITKVTLRNQVLVQTTSDDAIITLQK
jgi:hypothetical protein